MHVTKRRRGGQGVQASGNTFHAKKKEKIPYMSYKPHRERMPRENESSWYQNSN